MYSKRNETTTPVKELTRRIEEYKSQNKPMVVLVQTGAYNPVHRMHIEIFRIAKEYLENEKGFCVVGAYISPSHHLYVSSKCLYPERKLENIISPEDRCHLINLSVKDAKYEDWLFVDKWELSQNDFCDAFQVVRSLRKHLPETEIERVIYLVGSDFVLRGLRNYRSKNLGVCVIYRKMSDNSSDDFDEVKEGENFFIVKNKDEKNDASSTKIRNAFTKKEYDVAEKIMFPSAIEFLKNTNYFNIEKREEFRKKYNFDF